jgi:hypothetical protein
MGDINASAGDDRPDDERSQARRFSKMDSAVNSLQEAIKLCVTKVTRESLDEKDGRRAMEIIASATNLEHIDDITDKHLMELATRRSSIDASSPTRAPRTANLSSTRAGQPQTGLQCVHIRRRNDCPHLIEEKPGLRNAELAAWRATYAGYARDARRVSEPVRFIWTCCAAGPSRSTSTAKHLKANDGHEAGSLSS